MSGKRRRIDWTLWVVIAVVVLVALGPGLLELGPRCFYACFPETVPEFSLEQLEDAVIERPPGIVWKTMDLSVPDTKEELLAAYSELHPWVHGSTPVHPDVELRLRLVDGRTIEVGVQEGHPEIVVRVYLEGEMQSELHAAGRRMYELLLPDCLYP